jgi:hypothetical protein
MIAGTKSFENYLASFPRASPNLATKRMNYRTKLLLLSDKHFFKALIKGGGG